MAGTEPPVGRRKTLLPAFRAEPDDLSDHLHRQVIGYLGVLLPWVLLSVSGWRPTTGQPVWDTWDSISAYYYSGAGAVFVGVLGCLAVYFFTYGGYDNESYHWDRGAALVAGVAATGVALFPTRPPSEALKPMWWTENTGRIHYISSIVLFACFAFYCLFLFTKSKIKKPEDQQRPPDKKRRNAFYVFAGLAIVACMLWAWNWGHRVPKMSIFWPETIALEIFGLSWLVKGRALWTIGEGVRQLRGIRGSASAD